MSSTKKYCNGTIKTKLNTKNTKNINIIFIHKQTTNMESNKFFYKLF
ncbi:MAG: hypothetical protein Terrestrivirus1_354 [Terrestrivirus sp.]|uniref:Uncharacterized protein n=1 Tax=Terrestrivirus sp. TaxID=2487775 RepID=A0A3G4ZKW0_9VIRU|nr:MAG: hypothetical protein Terrestrivirus1_354 [Terrestrivirus sp.]